MTNILGIGLMGMTGVSLLADADWSQFRGPNGAGIAASDAKPPTTWSESQNLRWRTALPGPGSSSPIVSGNRVFITCYTGYGQGASGGGPDQLQRHLICLAREDGKIVWDKAVPAELPEDTYSGFITEHGYASSTPVTDGERVYVFFGKTGVLAFDLNGKELWKVNVGKLSSNRRWGSGASPMLFQNLVIVNAADESRSIRALDKLTGKEVWKAEASTLELCFNMPVLAPRADGQSDLLISAPGEVWGMNPNTGKLRWFAQSRLPGNVSPTMVVGDGVAYALGGFPQLGAVAVRTGGKGDVTESNVLWRSSTSSYVPSPVLHEGRLYFASDQGFAVCLNAKSGEVIFKERLSGASDSNRGGRPYYASVVLANGNLYATSRRNGVVLFAAKPEFSVIAQNKLAGDDSDFNATPAIAGRQLFLRSNRNLYCIEAMQSAGAGKTQ